MKSASEWKKILEACNVRPSIADAWSKVFAQEVKGFSRADELDDFLGQILHESNMLETVEENLNYSKAERICAVWPKRFPTVADALPFVCKPEALANKVYANRLGNGDEKSGDGWRFRGRGLVQVTGKANYKALSDIIKIDLVANPEYLREPFMALRVSVLWWENNVPDEIINNIDRVTRRVNGGTIGLAHRKELTDKAGKVV